jgi:hypothetical protein
MEVWFSFNKVSRQKVTQINRFHMSNELFVRRTCLAFEVPPREPEVKAAGREGESFVGKLTGLFKRGPAHKDYPTTEIYEGPLASRAYGGAHQDYSVSEVYKEPFASTSLNLVPPFD